MSCPQCGHAATDLLIDAEVPTILSACPPALLARCRRAPLQIRWCPACSLGFNATPLSAEELTGIYDDYVYISPRRGIGTSKYAGIIDLIRAHCRPTGATVEIGCSEGYLLEQLRGHGFSQLRGIEPGPQADAARQHGLTVDSGYFTAASCAPGSVDSFVLMHVFEHLPDPVAALQLMRTALAPGGRIVIEVPDFCGFHHQHLLYFTVPFMARLATATGLRIGQCQADGTTLRVVLGHAADPSLPQAQLPPVDMAARCRAAASSWASSRQQVDAALAAARGPILWWGAGAAAVVLLNLGDAGLVARSDLHIVDGDPQRAGLGMPGTTRTVTAAQDWAGTSVDTLIIASSFVGEITARADALGVTRRRTVAICPE